MNHTSLRGRISYRSDAGYERGREWFTITRQSDRRRTIRAQCEMDDSELLRDVTYTVNADWSPHDAYVMLNQHGAFVGAGWFAFDVHRAQAETRVAGGGRISQQMEFDNPIVSFGPHPVSCDVWHLPGFEKGQPVEGNGNIRRMDNVLTSSPMPNGASGPMLHHDPLVLERVGPEVVTVTAGTFETLHYRFVLPGIPAEDLWCTGEDMVMVKIRWDFLETTYELVELEGTS